MQVGTTIKAHQHFPPHDKFRRCPHNRGRCRTEITMTITSLPPENCAIVDLGGFDSPDHALCARCRAIKPIANFMRRATKNQALSWGYEGNYLLRYPSSTCLDCKPQPKPLHKLTQKIIRNHISSGNHFGSTASAEATLIKKKERQIEGIRSGKLTLKKKKAKSAWKPILGTLAENAITFARHHATISKGKSRSSPSQAHITYSKLIVDTAYAIRKIIRSKLTYGEAPSPTTTRWQDLLTDEERTNIQTHFDAIPTEESKRMRHTAVLNLTKYSDYVHYAPNKELFKD